MKNFRLFLLACLVLSACSNSPILEENEVSEIINKRYGYPKVVDYYIFCSDPEHVRRCFSAKLDSSGMVTINKTQKLKDLGNQLIRFTEKSKPYLLPTSKADRALDIQSVKVADLVISDVKILEISGSTGIVEYTTFYKNLTPFARLLHHEGKSVKKYKVKFVKTSEGWQLEN